MIAKNIKGKGFAGCVRYVMNESSELLEAEGVLAENAESMIRSFAMQRSMRSEIAKPVGHIPISFAPEDSPRMTNDFMLQLAKEYMQEMGIGNTQYIVVRHHNTDNDHLHIVYNRIDNDLKLISVNNDYKRNIVVCKKLKDKYGLTYGKGKERVKREKLNNPDKAKYKIYDAIMHVLPHCKNEKDLKILLKQSGIETEFKLSRATGEMQGISFRLGNVSFKGSQVDRKFSFANLKKEFLKKSEVLQKQAKEAPQPIPNRAKEVEGQTENSPKKEGLMKIGGVEPTPEQMKTLKEGGYIYLENMTNSKGQLYSAYVITDDNQQRAFMFKKRPDEFVKYGQYEMRAMDKRLIEAGYVTHAKVKWYGGGFAHPYLWKENLTDTDYKESWNDPRKSETTPVQTQSNTISEAVSITISTTGESHSLTPKDGLKQKKKRGIKR